MGGAILPVKKQRGTVETDISKAYTAVFAKITNIQVFNEFDHCKPYSGDEIKDYSLYVVKASALSMMFNKRYNLCYGFFLKKLISTTGVDVLAVKHPSCMRKVHYKKLIDDLWKMEVSDKRDEDGIIERPSPILHSAGWRRGSTSARGRFCSLGILYVNTIKFNTGATSRF